MSVKTERVTILTTPDFKYFLSSEAEKEGVSISELIRGRCLQKAARSDDEILLKALVDQVNESTARAKKALDEGLQDARITLNTLRNAKAAS